MPGSAHIFQLLPDREKRFLLRTALEPLGLPGQQSQVVLAVARGDDSHRVGLRLPLFFGEAAQHLVQVVAFRCILAHKRFVRQCGERCGRHCGNRGRRLAREAAAEDGEPGEGLLFGRAQQPPGVVEGSAQAALARGCVAMGARQKIQVCGHRRRDLRARIVAHPRRSQFDAQRQTAHGLADLDHSGGHRRRQRKVWLYAPRPPGEKRHGGELLRLGMVGGGRGQTAQVEDLLRLQIEPLARGGQNLHVGCGGQQIAQPADVVEQMFQVVEDEQQLALA